MTQWLPEIEVERNGTGWRFAARGWAAVICILTVAGFGAIYLLG